MFNWDTPAALTKGHCFPQEEEWAGDLLCLKSPHLHICTWKCLMSAKYSSNVFKCQCGYYFSTAACLHLKSLDICFLPCAICAENMSNSLHWKPAKKSWLIYVICTILRHMHTCGGVWFVQINAIAFFFCFGLRLFNPVSKVSLNLWLWCVSQ